MSDLRPGLLQKHWAWQANVIFQGKRHRSRSKREIRELRRQITKRQSALETAVKGGRIPLAEYMAKAIGIEGDLPFKPPQFPLRLTADQFLEPPCNVERQLAEGFGAVTRAEACRTTYWFVSHIAWLQGDALPEDTVKCFLIGQSRPTRQDLREHQTRNFIRRTGGIDVERFRISVLSDCPVSRAWWRWRVAVDAAASSEGTLDAETAHRILHADNAAWEALAMDSLRHVPVTSHSRLRAAVLCQFPDARRGEPGPDGHPWLRSVGRELARLGPSVSLKHIPWTELLELAQTAKQVTRPTCT